MQDSQVVYIHPIMLVSFMFTDGKIFTVTTLKTRRMSTFIN